MAPATPCACGFGPILAEADRRIAEKVAVDALPLYEREAKERQRAAGGPHPVRANLPEAGRARDLAAKDFGVSDEAAA